MKLLNTGWFFYLDSLVIYTEARKKIIKFNLLDTISSEFNLEIEIENIKFSENNKFLVNTKSFSIEYDLNFNEIDLFGFGRPRYDYIYKSKIFCSSFLLSNDFEYPFNWIIDKKSKKAVQLQIFEDIKFYEFHDEYFIPVTYMNAAQGHSYGPELSIYNYQGELVWSKDFREPDTYIDSEPVFHDELSVNSNVKICDDYVVVSTSTNHLFCYDIHTGKQIWCQNQFEGPFPNPQMVALDTEQKMIYVWMYMTFHKIDLLTGQIILSKDMWEWQDRFRHGYVSWTVTKQGLWSATQNHGVVACINKDTLDIDKTYHLESHGTINDSAVPHVTEEFIVIPDGLGNLEVIKR